MNLKDYMLEKAEKVNGQFGDAKSRVSIQIRSDKQCESQYESSQNSISKITCNDQVESLVNRIENMIRQYSIMLDKDKKLFPVDFFMLDLTILNCISALKKAAQKLDNNYCTFKYSQQDIDDIFGKIEICAEQFSSLSQRSYCQD